MLGFAPLLLAAAALQGAELRRDGRVADAAAVVGELRSGSPARRALLTESLLDRHDVALEVIRRLGPEDGAIAEALARAAFLRARPSAEEPGLEALETMIRLDEGLGEMPTVACAGRPLSLDALAYEVRRADLFPFPLLVDPAAISRRVQLAAGI